MKTETLLILAAVAAVGYLLYTKKSGPTVARDPNGTQTTGTSSQTGANNPDVLANLENKGTDAFFKWLGTGSTDTNATA
jgi:hypothetical protein